MAMSPSPVMALPKGFADLRKSMAQSIHFIPMYIHEIHSFHIPAGTEVCRQGRTLIFKNKKAWDLTVFAGMAWCRGSCSAVQGRPEGMVAQRNPSAQNLLPLLQGSTRATRLTETQREICLLRNSIHPLHRSSLPR